MTTDSPILSDVVGPILPPPPSPSSTSPINACRRCSLLISLANSSTTTGGTLLTNALNKTELNTSVTAVAAVANPLQYSFQPCDVLQQQPDASKQTQATTATFYARHHSASAPTMISSSFARLYPFFAESCSGQHSRGESSLELEAVSAVHQFAIAVQNIAVSEMLPRTADLIFVNLTTLDGQPYCLELTNKGWRVTSMRTDCMQGDFTRLELFTQYYESLQDLMDVISPGYRERFAENIAKRYCDLNNLQNFRRMNDYSIGPVSDNCSEEGEDSISTTPSSLATSNSGRKRPMDTEMEGRPYRKISGSGAFIAGTTPDTVRQFLTPSGSGCRLPENSSASIVGALAAMDTMITSGSSSSSNSLLCSTQMD